MRRTFQYLFSFLFVGGLLCSSGAFLEELEERSRRNQGWEQTAQKFVQRQLIGNKLQSMDITPDSGVSSPMKRIPVFYPTNQMPDKDVVTPITTVPIINPTNPLTDTPIVNPVTSTPIIPMTPYTTPNIDPTIGLPNTSPTIGTPVTGPTMGIPDTAPNMGSPSGQSWCIASQTASQTALQVALDYACGYGGADCSAIKTGGSCFNPDTVRDHASYAFNSYYQKNPVSTSCDFGGAAMITNIDPSTQGCQYPSASTSSSILNTTNPTGSSVFGTVSPDSSEATETPIIILTSIIMSLFTANHLMRLPLPH